MAFCPKCGREMGTLEAACSSCGYDFPATGDGATAGTRRGIDLREFAPVARAGFGLRSTANDLY